MAGSTFAQWSLTVVFCATGLHSLVRMAAPGPRLNRVSHATHVLMSAAMVAMAWPWGTAVPEWLSITVFAAAAIWYVYLARYRPAAHAGPGTAAHHHGPLLLWYHAAMMATMVWMAVLMARMSASDTPAVAGSGMPTSDMPMSGTPPGGDTMGTMAMGGSAQPWWSIGLTAAATALFVLAAGWFLLRLLPVRRWPRHPAPADPAGTSTARADPLDTIASLLMAIGMAAAFLLMA